MATNKTKRRKRINITPLPCETHKVVKPGYIEWHTWAEEQNKKKIFQSQCYVCGRWFFPEEM